MQQLAAAEFHPSPTEDPIDLETFVEYVPHEFQQTQLNVIYHTAQHTRDQENNLVSLYLFELLNGYGLDFGDSVRELRQRLDLESVFNEIEAMPLDDVRRWSRWTDALRRAPDDTNLLNAIRNSVGEATGLYKDLLRNGNEEDIELIARSVIDWLSGIHPTWKAWQRDEAEVLGSTVCYLFDWLIEQERVKLAVELVAHCPYASGLLRDNKWSIDMNKYWFAIELIADHLTNHRRHRNAQIIQIYGAFVSGRSKQSLVDVPDYEQLMLETGITSDDIIAVLSDKKLQPWLNPSLVQEIIDQR